MTTSPKILDQNFEFLGSHSQKCFLKILKIHSDTLQKNPNSSLDHFLSVPDEFLAFELLRPLEIAMLALTNRSKVFMNLICCTCEPIKTNEIHLYRSKNKRW